MGCFPQQCLRFGLWQAGRTQQLSKHDRGRGHLVCVCGQMKVTQPWQGEGHQEHRAFIVQSGSQRPQDVSYFIGAFSLDLEDGVGVPDPVWHSLSSSSLKIGTDEPVHCVAESPGNLKNIYQARPYFGDSASMIWGWACSHLWFLRRLPERNSRYSLV